MKSEAKKRNNNYLRVIGVVSFFIVVILAVGWFFAFKISKESAKITSESFYLNQESDKKTEIVQKYNRVAEYQQTAVDTLPSTKEISSFLADVQTLTDKNGIRINSSTIGSAQKTKSGNMLYSQTLSQKNYYELQIKYELEGSYQSFLTLLKDLKSLRRLNNISNLSIVKKAVNTTGDIVTVSFTDSIYIKK
jgi:Tfp pilus assembly protein PilO